VTVADLFNLDVDEIAFCKSGMNQKAKVLLYKTDDQHSRDYRDSWNTPLEVLHGVLKATGDPRKATGRSNRPPEDGTVTRRPPGEAHGYPSVEAAPSDRPENMLSLLPGQDTMSWVDRSLERMAQRRVDFNQARNLPEAIAQITALHPGLYDLAVYGHAKAHHQPAPDWQQDNDLHLVGVQGRNASDY
jgi:hypothetical protein